MLRDARTTNGSICRLRTAAILESNVMPDLAAAGDHSLSIEYPAAFQTRDCEPIGFPPKVSYGFAVLGGYRVHVHQNRFRCDGR
jgi:hypothetical protein